MGQGVGLWTDIVGVFLRAWWPQSLGHATVKVTGGSRKERPALGRWIMVAVWWFCSPGLGSSS